MQRLLSLIIFLYASCICPSYATDSRSFYWDAVEVDAHLDADGRLHVNELQRMVLTGAWNGGERRFQVAADQTLAVKSLVRIDAEGREHPMIMGNVEQVDHYALNNDHVLRWRSRLPTDPAFDASLLTYRISYELTGVLRTEDDRYVLDHDFSFRDRTSEIRRYVLRFTLDPVWTAEEDIPATIEAQQLQPGDGFILLRSLRYTGANLPAAVRHGASAEIKSLLLQSMVGGSILLLAIFLWSEARSGRFRTNFPLAKIDRAWLEQHVFAYQPEVVGALWDGRLGAAEVAAVLARMSQEGKITSRVETVNIWIFKFHRLHLELKVPRNTLPDYEAALVDALFFDGDVTDTDKVRAYYKGRRFDPSDMIEDEVLNQAARVAGPPAREFRRLPYYLVLCGAALLMMPVHYLYGTYHELLFGAVVVIGILFALSWCFDAAARFRRANDFDIAAWIFLISAPLVFGVPVVWLIMYSPAPVHTYLLVEYVSLWLLVLAATFFAARTRMTRKQIEQRHSLRSARAWFKEELKKPHPALENKWYPHLLAFELGRNMDRWFSAFGSSSVSRISISNLGDADSSSSVSSGTWSGGGGSFSGAGASGTWALAASGIASAMSAPSSSSSGSSNSRSGSSRSGGGGGGAW